MCTERVRIKCGGAEILAFAIRGGSHSILRGLAQSWIDQMHVGRVYLAKETSLGPSIVRRGFLILFPSARSLGPAFYNHINFNYKRIIDPGLCSLTKPRICQREVFCAESLECQRLVARCMATLSMPSTLTHGFEISTLPRSLAGFSRIAYNANSKMLRPRLVAQRLKHWNLQSRMLDTNGRAPSERADLDSFNLSPSAVNTWRYGCAHLSRPDIQRHWLSNVESRQNCMLFNRGIPSASTRYPHMDYASSPTRYMLRANNY